MTVNGTTYSVSPQQMAGLTPAEQQAIAAANQAIEYNPAGVSQQLQSPYDPLSSVTPPAQTGTLVSSAPPSATRGLPAPVAGANLTNPFYSSPAQQAADIRRAVALAQGPATTPTEITIPGGDIPAGVTPASSDTSVVTDASTGEYDYDPAQDPANYVRPIYPGDENQPGYFSPEQRIAYLQSLGGTRSSEFMTPIGREQDIQQDVKPEKTDTTEPEKTDKPNRPNKGIGRLKKNYVYTNYKKKIGRPDRDIVAFNNFNKRFFEKGGKVGDSVEAALRIAKSKLL